MPTRPRSGTPAISGADTRVRHIVGLDTVRGGVALADRVQVGMRLSFCQRHVAAARADLVRICAEIREELGEERMPEPQARRALPAHGAPADSPPPARAIRGALYVSCSDRGGRHFGAPGAELQILRRALGDVPVAGFFASGEIATRWLYGYTGVLTVFAG